MPYPVAAAQGGMLRLSGGGAVPWYQDGSALANSLVALWKLDEASGARADSVGANTLTDNNTVGSAVGLPYALAADFEADNNEYLSIVSNAAVQMGDIDFWIAAWVRMESKGATRVIAAKDYTGVAGTREYSLVYEPDRFQWQLFRSNGGVAIQVIANNIGSPSTATWYFVVAWHDAAADIAYIQVNNGTVDSLATGGALDPAAAAPLYIGARSYPAALAPWDGLIGQVAIGKGYLPTTDDRTFLYNGGLGRA